MNISPSSNTQDHFPNGISTPISRNLCHSVVQHCTDEGAFDLWKHSKSSPVLAHLDERIRDIVRVRYDIRQIDNCVKSPAFELEAPESIDTVLTNTAALPPRYQLKVLLGLLTRCVSLWHARPKQLSTLLIDIWLRRFEVRQEALTRFVEFDFTRMTPEFNDFHHLLNVIARSDEWSLEARSIAFVHSMRWPQV